MSKLVEYSFYASRHDESLVGKVLSPASRYPGGLPSRDWLLTICKGRLSEILSKEGRLRGENFHSEHPTGKISREIHGQVWETVTVLSSLSNFRKRTNGALKVEEYRHLSDNDIHDLVRHYTRFIQISRRSSNPPYHLSVELLHLWHLEWNGINFKHMQLFNI